MKRKDGKFFRLSPAFPLAFAAGAARTPPRKVWSIAMHITLEADYAVRIVHYLAVEGKRTDAKAISRQTGVTLRFALKILRKLVVSGIVCSFKGTQGGYEIARPLEEISLKDVIETVEGPYALSRCIDSEDYVCTNPNGGCDCSFQKVFADISDMVNEKLASVHFSDIVKS